MGFRVGYTFRTDGNNSQRRASWRASTASTRCRATFADPGVDGIRRQRRRRPGLHVVGHPGPGAGEPSPRRARSTSILATDSAIDLTFTKRMSNRFSLVTSYYYNWDRDTRSSAEPERRAVQRPDGDQLELQGVRHLPGAVEHRRHRLGASSVGQQPLARHHACRPGGQNITGTYEAEPNTALSHRQRHGGRREDRAALPLRRPLAVGVRRHRSTSSTPTRRTSDRRPAPSAVRR